jgi:hypothetical protein
MYHEMQKCYKSVMKIAALCFLQVPVCWRASANWWKWKYHRCQISCSQSSWCKWTHFSSLRKYNTWCKLTYIFAVSSPTFLYHLSCFSSSVGFSMYCGSLRVRCFLAAYSAFLPKVRCSFTAVVFVLIRSYVCSKEQLPLFLLFSSLNVCNWYAVR